MQLRSPTGFLLVFYIANLNIASAASPSSRNLVADAVSNPSLPHNKVYTASLAATLSPIIPHSLASPIPSSFSQPTCPFSSLARRIAIYQATTCHPLSSSITHLSNLYQHLQHSLIHNTNNISAELESSLRIAFHFGTFSLLIYALQPVLKVDVALAVAAVIGAFVTCVFCVTLCTFTMVVQVGIGCGAWMMEMMWEGRRRVDGIVVG